MKRVRTNLFFVAVLGVLALGGSAWDVESSESIQGLISHWKFDEGQGSIAYDSAGGNDGTVYGATWTTGQIGGALDFDGVDDYIDVGDVAFLDGASEATFSLWVKLDSLTLNQKLIHKIGGIGNRSFQVSIDDVTSGEFVGDIFDGTKRYFIRSTNAALKTGEWYHLVFVWNGGDSGNLYKNGIQLTFSEATTTTPVTISDSSVPLAIGIQANDLSSNPFNGKMDDVRIYNRALSPEEIWQLYRDGASGPVSHWKFDEGQGSIAYDSAGGNDGTVYGAVWTTGQIDGALSFDGVDDYVDVGNDSSLKPPLPVTLSAWIRLSSLGSPQAIVALDDRSIGRYGIGFFVMHENNLQISYADGGSPGPASRRTKVGATALSANTWYHVAAVLRGPRDMDIYINGVDDGGTYSGTGGSLTYSASGHSFIGSDAAVQSYLNGKIDEVAIYNRALSPEEIQQLYQGELADLVGLEIVGPGEVAENFSASYKAIAYYDNNETKDVTQSVLWAVEPNTYADINDNGALTTKDVSEDRLVTILADYTVGNAIFEAEKVVDIFPICSIGTALSFDGEDDYVEVMDDESQQISTNQITLSAWIKLGADVGNTQRRIICKQEHAYIAWGLEIFGVGYRGSSGNQLVFHDSDGGTAYRICISPTDLNLDQWYHVAAIDNAGAIEIYINGRLNHSCEDGYGIPSSINTPIMIGTGPSTLDFFFNGKMDEVEIFNRALSAEEIRANMHRRLAGDETGLVGYWDFDEGEGQIVYDLSGNGNNGQLGSTPKPDVSDPAWVKSYAPIGICTLYQIATKAAERALERKLALLEELLGTLAEEWTAYEALEELLESGDYGDLNKGDIVTAKQKIHSATQHEEQVIDALEKSIEKLKDALNALGYEPEPPVPNQPPNVNITNPQDGAVFGSSETIEIEANAWDVDGSVVKVEFFANGSKIGEDNDGTDGWKTNWYDHPSGTYSLTAKATDNDGAATTSPAVGITVVELPPPPPPPP